MVFEDILCFFVVTEWVFFVCFKYFCCSVVGQNVCARAYGGILLKKARTKFYNITILVISHDMYLSVIL